MDQPVLSRPSGPETHAATGAAETAVAREAARRRAFAIIAHPDAGKTTLTEKLLLRGGAIQLAGQVRAKGDRRAADVARRPSRTRRGGAPVSRRAPPGPASRPRAVRRSA